MRHQACEIEARQRILRRRDAVTGGERVAQRLLPAGEFRRKASGAAQRRHVEPGFVRAGVVRVGICGCLLRCGRRLGRQRQLLRHERLRHDRLGRRQR